MISRAISPSPEPRSPSVERLPPSSGLWPTGARGSDDTDDASERITVPVPAPREAAAAACVTTKVPASNRGMRDVHVPPAPLPFSLTPRRRSNSGYFRAEIVAEWVKLNAHDPRVE